jgi:TPP-dependent pyruvate/acetoin dehydrogenase alpha subunit
LCSYASIAAQEAAAVGAVIDLFPEDTICPSQSDFIPSFIKGMPLDELFRQLDARAASIARVRRSKSRSVAQFNIATGLALVNKINKNNKIAVSFSDARATAPSAWHDALKFAGDEALPIIFVHQNCMCNESATMKLKANGTSLKEQAYGFPSITVDGTDAVAVYRVASEAIAHARKGNGPTLIECMSSGQDADSIQNMEKYLTRKGLYSEVSKARVTAAFCSELDRAIERAQRGALASAD